MHTHQVQSDGIYNPKYGTSYWDPLLKTVRILINKSVSGPKMRSTSTPEVSSIEEVLTQTFFFKYLSPRTFSVG